MAPSRVHLVRHAQGYHNLCLENHHLPDPLLTPQGEQECIALSKDIQESGLSIDCIVASPSRRALYTALLTFDDVLNTHKNLKIIALPELQETAALPCDVGLPLDKLQEEFEGKPVDFSLLDEDWNNKFSGPFAPRVDLVQGRAHKARKFLQMRPEHELAVVTHGALLHFLTEDWAGCLAGCGTGWKNCEMRTYTFDTRNKDAIANASVIETPESIGRRSHDLQPLTQDEQVELREIAQRTWAAEGYIIIPAATFLLDHTNTEPHTELTREKMASPPTNTTSFQARHSCAQNATLGVKALL